MKQKIMVLALLGVPMFVSADVTLYGHIKGGLAVENIKRESLGEEIYKNDSKTNTVVQDYASRIGFKGEEDLGNGLKTIWQSEQFVSLGGNRKGWSTRETFIGLKGDAGTVKIGYLRNVFDSNMRNIDPWEYDLMGWTTAPTVWDILTVWHCVWLDLFVMIPPNYRLASVAMLCTAQSQPCGRWFYPN